MSAPTDQPGTPAPVRYPCLSTLEGEAKCEFCGRPWSVIVKMLGKFKRWERMPNCPSRPTSADLAEVHAGTPAPVTAKVRPYFDFNGVTIYHGDSRDVLPELSLQAPLVVTDPPYGVTYQSNSGGHRGKEPITNDGTRLSLALYRQVVPLLAHLEPQHVLWFTRWDAWPDVWSILGQFFPVRGLLVWDKGTPGMGDLKHWGPSYELIASVGRGQTVGSRDQSVLAFTGVGHGARLHPTEKPVALLSYLIGKFDDALVLDPFVGSGATLQAAQMVGRAAVGIEIEERYCEAAARRVSQGSMSEMFGSAQAEPAVARAVE